MATGGVGALKGESGDFIIHAIRRWNVIETTDRENRDQQRFAQAFYAGDQWDEDILERRRVAKRPVVTINRLPEPVRHVTNAQRRDRPRIRILPVDDGADIRTAEILQGLIRSIENNSNATVAYMTAGENAAISGRGYIRVQRRYVNPASGSIDQELAIKRVRYPFSIYMDTGAEELDGRDARYAFAIEDIPEDEFKERWPHAKFTSTRAFTGFHHIPERWNLYEKHIRVAEYFYVTYDTRKVRVVRLENGQIRQFEKERGGLPRGAKVIHTHTVRQRKIHRAVISGAEVLEGNNNLTAGSLEPGQWIPIVPVVGEERIATREGRVHHVGIVHDAVDGQRMFNWAKSTLLETSMLAPRTPFVIESGQLEGFERLWKTAHEENYPYLPYKKVLDGAGRAVPPPGRPQSAPAITDMITVVAQADEDLKSTTRRHDASLGQRGPQESARAIKERKGQDDHANYNFLDNLALSVQHVGRICVDQIPFVYNTPRIERILGEDEVTSERILIQPGFAQKPAADREYIQNHLPEGIDGIFDLGTARYDVAVEVGPGYATRRQHAADVMQELFKAVPSLFAEAGDLLVHFLDIPGGRKLMERLRYQIALRGGLPPTGPDGKDLDPEIAATLRKFQMQLQQAGQKIEELQKALDTKQVEADARLRERQLDAATRERIAGHQADTDLEQTRLNLEGKTQAEVVKVLAGRILELVKGQIKSGHIDLQGAVDIDKIHEQGKVDLEVSQVEAAAAEEAAARSDARQEGAAARSDRRKEDAGARADLRKGVLARESDERRQDGDKAKQLRDQSFQREQKAEDIAEGRRTQERTRQIDLERDDEQAENARRLQEQKAKTDQGKQERQIEADRDKQGRQIDADKAKQQRDIRARGAQQGRQIEADAAKQDRDIKSREKQARQQPPKK